MPGGGGGRDFAQGAAARALEEEVDRNMGLALFRPAVALPSVGHSFPLLLLALCPVL